MTFYKTFLLAFLFSASLYPASNIPPEDISISRPIGALPQQGLPTARALAETETTASHPLLTGWTSLPIEILINIFERLSPEDLETVGLASRPWRAAWSLTPRNFCVFLNARMMGILTTPQFPYDPKTLRHIKLSESLENIAGLPSLNVHTLEIDNPPAPLETILEICQRLTPSSGENPSSEQKKFPKIRALKCPLTTIEALQGLATALKVNTTLTHLNLSESQLGHKISQVLGQVLILNTPLTHLNLSFNQMGEVETMGIAIYFAINKTLTHLDLSHNQIGNYGIKVLAQSLKVNKSIAFLNLSFNQIGPEGALALADMLILKETFTHLDLSHNAIQPIGAQALGIALATNTALTYLDLGSNGVDDSGMETLRMGLENNKFLKFLGLSSNQISVVGAQDLRSVITTNTTLTDLDLGSNALDDQSMAILAMALRRNTTLSHLDLSHNTIGYNGTKALVKALRKNKGLRSLSLDENSAECTRLAPLFQQIAAKRPGMKISI